VLFGSVGIGVSPAIRVVTIRNLSKRKTLTVSMSAMAAPYAVLSGLGPFAIAPLRKTAVTIQFTPTVIGRALGSLNLASSDPHHPTFRVAIFGRGAVGTLTLPTGVGFGAVGVGVTPKSLSFAVKNTGIGVLTGSVGTLDAPFSVSAGGGPFNLAPGRKQIVTVQFAPTSVGHVSAALAITSDDPSHLDVPFAIGGKGAGGHLTVNLPAPIAPATMPALGFGAVAANATLIKTFTVTNTGLGVLDGNVAAFAPGVAFSLTQGAGAFTLQPGQKLTIGVQFAPTASGRASATLTISDTAPGTPTLVTVAMSGRGK
jgi:hypothetical protein